MSIYIIGTHNDGKLAEIARVLEPLGVACEKAESLGVYLSEPEETGTTFAENARIKALAAMRESGYPAVGDDSGLVVDALDGRPGVYTARYGGGHDVPFSEKIPLLLAEMEGVPPEKRTARFVCAVCVAYPDGTLISAQGTVEGHIGFVPTGDNGFGFDPIFYIGARSFAEYSDAEKDAVSHRGRALRSLAEKIRQERKE